MIKIWLFHVFPCPAGRWGSGAKRAMIKLHYVQNTLGWQREAKYSRHLSSPTSAHCGKLWTLAEISNAASEMRVSPSAIRAPSRPEEEGGSTVLTKFPGSSPLSASAFISKFRQFLNFPVTSWSLGWCMAVLCNQTIEGENLGFQCPNFTRSRWQNWTFKYRDPMWI